jgi:hydrogenase maturation protein HypF
LTQEHATLESSQSRRNMHAREIQVNGIVQGVGFRPHVARLARSLGCVGWVLNSADGVSIHVEHDSAAVLEHFEITLVDAAPCAACILKLKAQDVQAVGYEEFSIRASEQGDSRTTLVSPDLATCDACTRELFDPNDRRFHYPFINCTNCGPRFTIINDLPYDRPVTSMRDFAMCPTCAAEYADDTDRRYHAQPDACFSCGPRLWWISTKEALSQVPGTDRFSHRELQVEPAQITREESDALIAQAADRLGEGSILAIKGLGGWHLSCDATNEQAVSLLRARKHRPSKPLAIMVRDIEMARRYAQIDDEEASLLASAAHPIVLLKRTQYDSPACGIADDLPEIGIMLPATPVQHLLLHATNRPLVMTSGNRSGEPIVASDQDAFEALGTIADWFLGNTRAIVARYDDSVVRMVNDAHTQLLRRARGYAPVPLLLDDAAGSAPGSTARHMSTCPTIFAAGPEQKATFATLDANRVFISQHLGDLEHLGAWRAWEEARDRYEHLFDTHPQAIACDMHPEYLASKWARAYAADNDLPLIEVQHHHAHIASVLGETGQDGPVIGIALDGTGYGTDGTIWGGEILIATRADFERFWHLPTFRLPGGVAAIRHPKRTAYALLRAYDMVDAPQFASFLDQVENRELLDQMMDKNINSPICSSAGRLFDGVAALLGVCTEPGYDGEAACLLEAAALREGRDTISPTSQNPLTAWSFHEKLINAIIEQTLEARNATGLRKVALSGGCMVNRIVSTQLEERLADLGFEVLANCELPPNDGCIAYGQAIVAQARLEA